MGEGTVCWGCGEVGGDMEAMSRGRVRHPGCRRPWVTPFAVEHDDRLIRGGNVAATAETVFTATTHTANHQGQDSPAS